MLVAVLNILTYPDKRLRLKSKPIKKIDENIRRLADDMAETMYTSSGIGLAAPQIGILKRLVVMDLTYHEDKPELFILINPEIIKKGSLITREEGCLSFPGILEDIKRAGKVLARWQNLDGKTVEIEAEELMAVALQHEIDHLDGILIIDHLSLLKRQMLKKQMKKLKNKKSDDA